MHRKNAKDVDDVSEWFWTRGVSALLRALSSHGLSGACLLLGSEAAGKSEGADTEPSFEDEGHTDAMSFLDPARAHSSSDDGDYEPVPLVVPVRRPLVAWSSATC